MIFVWLEVSHLSYDHVERVSSPNHTFSWAKKVSMIRKYHNHKLQTNPWLHEEEPHNNHDTPGRQTKQSNKLDLAVNQLTTVLLESGERGE